MRRIVVVVAIGMLFCFPETGNAAAPNAFCSTYTPTDCYAREASDTLEESVWPNDTWGFVKAGTGQHGRSSSAMGCSTIAYPPVVTSTGCNAMRARLVTYTFSRKHIYNWKYPWLTAVYVALRFDDGYEYVDAGYDRSVLKYEGHNKPLCGYPFENPYTVIENFKQVPKADAPADYVAFCFPDYVADPTQDPTTNPTQDPTTEPPTATKPQSNCGVASTPKQGRVKVTARGARCNVARGIIVRYLRTGKNQAGWVCVSATAGRLSNAKCVQTSRAGAQVAGSWRR